MSHDDHLVVSCKCGKLVITKIGGYETSDLLDAAELGQQAERLCRRKRLKQWAYFVGLPLLTASLLAIGTVWWSGRQAVTTAQHRVTVEHHLLRGFSYYQSGDYDAAIRECDEALKLDPANEAAKANRELAERYRK